MGIVIELIKANYSALLNFERIKAYNFVQESFIMKLVYAIPKRASSKRPAARHIDNGNGRPLCGGNGREPYFWAPEEGEPTCKICQDLAFMTAEMDDGAENNTGN
jgi:hypothetical protein